MEFGFDWCETGAHSNCGKRSEIPINYFMNICTMCHVQIQYASRTTDIAVICRYPVMPQYKKYIEVGSRSRQKCIFFCSDFDTALSVDKIETLSKQSRTF